MRIADVCGFYSPRGGGVRRYVETKFAAADRRGHDLTLIAPGPTDLVETRRGGRCCWVASPPVPTDPAYHRFAAQGPIWRILDDIRPEVVEGSSPWRSASIAGRWPGRAVRSLVLHQDFVAAYAQTLLDRYLPPAAIEALCGPWWTRLRRLSRLFDVTLVGGESLARRLADRGVKRPTAIPLGLEAGLFSPAFRQEALRRELLARCGAPQDGRLILAVGRLHPEKRQRVLIEGYRLARARSPYALGLVLAGDGPDRVGVERRARTAGGVALLGAVSRTELPGIYASVDLFIHGSAAETYGIAVAEALASGLPIVVPAAGGAADLAKLGRSRLYAPGDAESLCEAILAELAQPSPDPIPSLPTAEAHFSALFALYERLIEQRRKAPSCGSRSFEQAL